MKIGGDVNYLFLEVLARLKPGVIVHVHDIFLPFEYRRDWVLDEFRFWAEQYLLQAFLTFNSEFEVLMANNYLNQYHEEELKAAFPNLSSWGGGSRMRRQAAEPLIKVGPNGGTAKQASFCGRIPAIGNQYSHLVPGSPSKFFSRPGIKLDGRFFAQYSRRVPNWRSTRGVLNFERDGYSE